MEHILPIILLLAFIFAMYKAVQRGRKIDQELATEIIVLEKQELEKALSIEEDKNKIKEKINEFINNGNTTSTYTDKSNKTYGGKINTEGWHFNNVLRFISKNRLRIKDLDLKTINPMLEEELKTSDGKPSQRKFADQIENIAHKKQIIEMNNQCIQNIKIINKYSEYCSKLKKWIIINIETILLEEAKKGQKLPLTLDPSKYNVELKIPINDYTSFITQYDQISIRDAFSFLKIKIEGDEHYTYNLSERDSDNHLKKSVFEMISRNIKFKNHLTNLGLKYKLSHDGVYDNGLIFTINKIIMKSIP